MRSEKPFGADGNRNASYTEYSTALAHPREVICETIYSWRDLSAMVKSDGWGRFVHGGTRAPGAVLTKELAAAGAWVGPVGKACARHDDHCAASLALPTGSG